MFQNTRPDLWLHPMNWKPAQARPHEADGGGDRPRPSVGLAVASRDSACWSAPAVRRSQSSRHRLARSLARRRTDHDAMMPGMGGKKESPSLWALAAGCPHHCDYRLIDNLMDPDDPRGPIFHASGAHRPGEGNP